MKPFMNNSKLGLHKNQNLIWPFMRRVAFLFDAELMHESAISLFRVLSTFVPKNKYYDSLVNDECFKTNALGLKFKNPIGLAAGFDVDASCIPFLQYLGFGFIEVGGITETAQSGNNKPRIFRLEKDQALINRLNFYNKGVSNLRKRLLRLRSKNLIKIPIGVNLGKSNTSDLRNVPHEYLNTFKKIHDVVDYATINISCPNSAGLDSYQTANSLGSLLDTLCNFNEGLKNRVPLILKLGPDIKNEGAIAAAEIALDYNLSGLIISNTTKKRPNLKTKKNYEEGGLSGKPLFERSTQLLRCVAKDYGKKLTLIGSGGIMDGSYALAKLNAGADLLQVYTGFVYGGPNFVIGLLKYLKTNYHQYKNLSH